MTYCLLGPLMWMFFGVVMVSSRIKMMLLPRRPVGAVDGAPSVTILIPAKDEATQIRTCLDSVLRQDYPNFKVVAINDRSSDATGSILDEIASRDPRVSVVHIRELPAGWTGKNNALMTAMPGVKSDWLLFLDADVSLEADAVSAVMAFATSRQNDLFSLLPRVKSQTFFEALLTPLCGAAVNSIALVAMTNFRNWPKVAWANGQFLVVRREVYDAIGTHASVRDMIGEDVGLARKAKAMNYKTRVALGTDYAAVRMYDSFGAMMRGWARNFFTGSFGRPWKILLAMTFVLMCCLSVYAVLGWSMYRANHFVDPFYQYAWLVAGSLHWIVMTVLLAIIYGWSGMRRAYALIFPIGAALLLWILMKSLLLCVGGKVDWRGNTYARMWKPE